MALAPGKRGRRVLADQKAGGWGRGDGRGAAGPFSGGLSTKIHLAVCIKIQRRASGSLKTWACINPPFCAPGARYGGGGCVLELGRSVGRDAHPRRLGGFFLARGPTDSRKGGFMAATDTSPYHPFRQQVRHPIRDPISHPCHRRSRLCWLGLPR